MQHPDPLFNLPLEDLEAVARNCDKDLQELRHARIFLTGGTGFFGKWLVGTLCHANDRLGLELRLAVLTRDPGKLSGALAGPIQRGVVETVSGDVRSFDFPQGRFTHVIHGAADTSAQAARQPLELIDVIVSGTRRVLEFARTAGAAQLLFISSGAVYGPQPKDLEQITEDYSGACTATDAGPSYGHAKRLAEDLCVLHSGRSGVQAKIARCFAFVGPHLPLDAHFAIGNFIRDALWGKSIRINSDGSSVRSYLYTSDLVEWLLRILVRGTPARAYNVGSDQAVTISELGEMCSRLAGKNMNVSTERGIQAATQRSRYIPSIGLARDELGLHMRTPIEWAIVKTADWYRFRSDLPLGTEGDTIAPNVLR